LHISHLYIRGYRNFEEANINFKEKSLVIGANDIGKSNLISALRLLLDKKLSEADLEPKDSDFHVHKMHNEIFIQVKFEQVTEDCIIGKLGKYVSESKEMFLAYHALRNETGEKSYSFLIGLSADDLQEIDARFYLKVLNMEYIESSRELFSYIKREKKNLLLEAKKQRSDDLIRNDDKITRKIERTISVLNKRITDLSYISNATENLNQELVNLSFHHISNNITFDAGGTDVNDFINNLDLVSKVKEKSLSVGGDGRNNQIYLALRTSKNRISPEEPLEVTICCIEEPEAHLHPHQQRRLAKYLVDSLRSQVIITSHSPQIACEFSPDSIIRLYNDRSCTLAANDGCSDITGKSLLEFGFRLNIIPTEAFFSNVVLLVEGPSEVVFYKALAVDLGIDLDKYNISILMVDGVGFDPFVDMLENLCIEWVARTDNDIFKVPYKDYYYFSGVSRAVKIYEKNLKSDPEFDALLDEKRTQLTGINNRENLTDAELAVHVEFKAKLQTKDIYLSDIDLENDLVNSQLRSALESYYGETNLIDLLNMMQKRKATNMFEFLSVNQGKLDVLCNTDLVKPLLRCKEIVEELFGETNSQQPTDEIIEVLVS
jgi:putative ATP-dependent endonuclease of OLD family